MCKKEKDFQKELSEKIAELVIYLKEKIREEDKEIFYGSKKKDKTKYKGFNKER